MLLFAICLRSLLVFAGDRDHDCAVGRGHQLIGVPRASCGALTVSYAIPEYQLERPSISELPMASGSHAMCLVLTPTSRLSITPCHTPPPVPVCAATMRLFSRPSVFRPASIWGVALRYSLGRRPRHASKAATHHNDRLAPLRSELSLPLPLHPAPTRLIGREHASQADWSSKKQGVYTVPTQLLQLQVFSSPVHKANGCAV